jgi:RND superfamily putative drug exporter
LLVAVGADYNMLLISRIRDESPHGVRVGVIRTVGSTGGVITSAGLIFAASMFGLMTASIYTMAEAGFILGMGILIDTFLVRTITVPALAAMIGQKNWWPSYLGKSPAQMYVAHQKKQQQLEQLTEQLVRMKIIPGHRSKTLSPAATSVGALRNGHAEVGRNATSDSSVTTNGGSSTDQLYDHALPVFDLSGLSHNLTYELREPALDSVTTGNGNGEQKIDRYLGHSLPLFGQHVLSARPIIVGTNGKANSSGKANVDRNGHGEQSIEDDLSNPLPLFGSNVLSHQAKL